MIFSYLWLFEERLLEICIIKKLFFQSEFGLFKGQIFLEKVETNCLNSYCSDSVLEDSASVFLKIIFDMSFFNKKKTLGDLSSIYVDRHEMFSKTYFFQLQFQICD